MPDAEVVDKSDDNTTDHSKEAPSKSRSVSFNRDVHVKRIAPNRASSLTAPSAADAVRRQHLVGLTKEKLAQEAAKVLAQASSVHCSSTSPPDKFFSLPTRNRRSNRPSVHIRRRSEELGVTTAEAPKRPSSLARSVSDASGKKHHYNARRIHNNTIFNLFKRPDKDTSHSGDDDAHESHNNKKESRTAVKRSKSDVSDLKSSGSHHQQQQQHRQIRKRTGSESDEYLNSVSGKKTQLSPIIESSNTPQIERFEFQYKVNPIEKPPRKAPVRPKRAKTFNKAENLKPVKNIVQHFDTLPRSKRIVADEIDANKNVKKLIRQTIQSLNQTDREPEMIHSSQRPPEKLPLTKGQTVDSMVKILNQDKYSPPPKATLVVPPSTAAHNNNQPFSYTKPTSVSPDPNLYARSLSPEGAPSPINKTMSSDVNRGVIYAQVVCGEDGKGGAKQTVHTSVTPDRQRFAHNSDEDEGLGYEDSRRQSNYRNSDEFSYDIHKNSYNYEGADVTDSPITPRFKEFKTHKLFDDDVTYENQNVSDLRGRGDGMDHKRNYDQKIAELSHRRELLENRFNARLKRDHISPTNNRFSPEKENQEVKNFENFENNEIAEFGDRFIVESRRSTEGTMNRNKSKKLSTEEEMDRREFIDNRLAEEPRDLPYFNRHQSPTRYFPPEPEYEPPSLDSQTSGKYSPENRKYKPKSARSSSQEGVLASRYSNTKQRQEKFSSNRNHYASNPEIFQNSGSDKQFEGTFRPEYDPARPETFHNSLQRQRHVKSDRNYYKNDYSEQSSSRSLRQQATVESRRDYGDETSGPESSRSRFDNDRDRDNKFADSGIENDYRKDSNGDIHQPRGVVLSSSANETTTRHRHVSKGDLMSRNESEDEGFASSLLIASERQHTEDNCLPKDSRRIQSSRHDDMVHHRERNIDDGSFYDPRLDKFEERTPTPHVNAKPPPKPVKKLSSLEKVKQLFSRDSSKKSKIKEKDKKKIEIDRPHSKNDNGMVREEDLRRRYTEYRGSTEELDVLETRRSSRLSRNSDLESDSRMGVRSRASKNREEEKSSAMDYDYSQRRRMATPTPSPSPPRRSAKNSDSPRQNLGSQQTTSNGWFKSLDRLSKNKTKQSKLEKESIITTTEEESTSRSKRYSSNGKLPTKNLRFFGDTDLESNDSISKHHSILRKRSNISDLKGDAAKSSNRAGKSTSSSLDRKYKSASLTNLQSPLDSRQNLLMNSYNKEKYNNSKRDLHNISEIHSNSETESQFEERERRFGDSDRDYQVDGVVTKERKPPMSPIREKWRSKSQGPAKSVSRNGYHGSKGDLSDDPRDLRLSKSDIRNSRQELSSSRNELRSRRRRLPASATSPGDSSTEGDSSHQSQKSIVYLHAATVGDIPSTGRISRGRSRDDVSSVNSSLRPQTKTVSRSFSVLAPWKPRHYREAYDINYSQSGHQSTLKRPEKNSKSATLKNSSTLNSSKSSSTRNLSTSKYDRSSEERSLQNKSNTSTLSRLYKKDDDSKRTTPNGTLFGRTDRHRSGNTSSKENLNSYQFNTASRSRNDLRDRSKKSMSTEVLSKDSPSKGTKRSSVERERLSRSISMPKDPNKSAGWFRITKKSKKVENSSRMY